MPKLAEEELKLYPFSEAVIIMGVSSNSHVFPL